MKPKLARLLCVLQLHHWDSAGANATSTGDYERCRRCGLLRLVMLCGGGIYYQKPGEKWSGM